MVCVPITKAKHSDQNPVARIHVHVQAEEAERERDMEGERRVGVAVDFSACSKRALKWAVDNVVRNGDHLILVTVRPEGHYEKGEMQLWEVTGSRMFSLPLIFLLSNI